MNSVPRIYHISHCIYHISHCILDSKNVSQLSEYNREMCVVVIIYLDCRRPCIARGARGCFTKAPVNSFSN